MKLLNSESFIKYKCINLCCYNMTYYKSYFIYDNIIEWFCNKMNRHNFYPGYTLDRFKIL